MGTALVNVRFSCMSNRMDVHTLSPEAEMTSKPSPADERAIKGRAIVTYGRSLISLVIARSLHERGIEVIGADDVGMTVLSFSKHVKDTFIHASLEKDEDEALNDFEEAVRKYAPEDDRPYVLIPAFRDAKLFAKHRNRFEPLIQIAAPEIESISKIDPKDALAEFAQKHDLDIPETHIIQPEDFNADDYASVDFPRIAKPVDGVGGRGVEKIASLEKLKDYVDAADPSSPILLQELVEGEDYCVSVVANKGELLGAVTYHNLRQFPNDAGAGAIRETVDETPFLESTRKLLELSNWHGVAEIDFRWNGDPDTPPKIIEINPRYWAGLFHSTASGIDFPWLAFALAADIEIDRSEDMSAEIGFKSKTPGAWLLSIAEETASSDEHLKQSGRAWVRMKYHASRGHILKATSHFLKSAGHSAATPGMLSTLQKEVARHDDLPSEFSADDDPAVGLGILFALSSLARHGELPPELKFEAPGKDEEEPAQPERKPRKTDRPVIGITKPEKGDFLAYLAMKLAVWLAGGSPVKITSSAPRDPRSIDGLLFGGGSDVYPEHYQGQIKPGYQYDHARDALEESWAKTALRQNIPVLGVCRGMQMLNVLQGGTLSSDLSKYDDIKYPMTFLKRLFFRKSIAIKPDSWLARITGKNLLSVNSIHTQAIQTLGNGFTASAHEINGLIQSIEHKDADFMVGVQFHPEFLIHKRFAREIFKQFIGHARNRMAPRDEKSETRVVGGALAD